MECLISFLDQWQTLITGFIAVGAAFIGGYYINKQIRQTADLDADQRARELLAARSMLPIQLAAMIDHVTNQAHALIVLRRACPGSGLPSGAFTRDTFPPVTSVPSHVAAFFEAMVLKADKSDRAKFTEILAEVQVSDSRILDLRKGYLEPGDSIRVVTSSEIDSFLLQLADIHARCGALFDYARPTETLHQPDGYALSTSLHNMGLRDYAFPSVFAELRRRSDRRARNAVPNDGSEAAAAENLEPNS